MSFKYRASNPDVVKRHAESSSDFDRITSDSVPSFVPADGENRVRILPRTWEGEPQHWAYPLWIHYDIGPDSGRYLCPKKMGKGDCPMCEERAKLDAEGDQDGAAALRPNISQACYVIDRDEEEKGPKVWLMPAKKLERPICSLSRDRDTGEVLQIDHPDKGYDVYFSKSGKGKNTDYTAAAIARKSSELADNDDDYNAWLDFIEKNPIPSVLNEYDYEYLSGIFGGARRKSKESDEPTREERRGGRDRVINEDDDKPPPSSRRGRVVEEEEDLDNAEPAKGKAREEDPRTRTRSRAIEEEKPASGRARSRVAEEEEEPVQERSRPTSESGAGSRDRSRGRDSDSPRGEREEEKPVRRGNLREEVSSGLKRRNRE